MVQQLTRLARKSDDLSSIPGIPVKLAGGKSTQLSSAFRRPGAPSHTHTNIIINEFKFQKLRPEYSSLELDSLTGFTFSVKVECQRSSVQ